MLEKIKYVNSRGESIVFGEHGIYVNENTLRDWEWEYNDTYGRIRGLRRKKNERTLPVQIWAESESRGVAIKNRLHDITEVDVVAGTPGRLYVGDWYLPCYVIKSVKGDYLASKCSMTVTLTLAVDSGSWYCTETINFSDQGSGLKSAVVGKALVGFAEVGNDGSGASAEELTTYPMDRAFTIEGATIQEGSGTPSASNVRPIKGRGVNGCVVLDGSTDEAWSKYTTTTVQTKSSVFYVEVEDSAMALGSSFCSSFRNTGESAINAWHAQNDGQTMLYTDHPERTRKYFRWGGPDATVEDFRAYLDENPVTLWYTKATSAYPQSVEATYVCFSDEFAGGVYRANAVRLHKPLFEGDKVLTNVDRNGVSSYVRVSKWVHRPLDGTTTGRKFTSYAAGNYAMIQLGNHKGGGEVICSHAPSDNASGVWLGSSGMAYMLTALPSSVTSLDTANTWLAAQYEAGTPVTILYELEEPLYSAMGSAVALADLPDSYRYDYPKGYSFSARADYIVNDCAADAAWKILVHGPAANPAVTIGGVVHRLNYTIPAGAYAEINSRERAITLFTASGATASLFRYRDKVDDIFAPVPPGSHFISWNGDYAFSLELYKERSEPKWT